MITDDIKQSIKKEVEKIKIKTPFSTITIDKLNNGSIPRNVSEILERNDADGYLVVHTSNKCIRALLECDINFNSTDKILSNSSILSEAISMSTDINSILFYYFNKGIIIDPIYQRGYEWGTSNKVDLIESIFNGNPIGNFILYEKSLNEFKDGEPEYEILDGKQRLSAIVDFMHNKFTYNGLYYCELKQHDVIEFKTHPITIYKLKNMSLNDRIRAFLSINKGITINKNHLQAVQQLLHE